MRNNAFDSVRLFWHHAWRYPRYVAGIFVSVPITILVYSFLPPLVLAHVLNRLSTHDYQPHHVWASFGTSLITYAVLALGGGVLCWRIVDIFGWKLEASVERDLAQRIYGHVLGQSADFHANTFGGSLVSQTSKLLGSYIRFADTTIFQVLPLVSSLLWATVILAPRAPLFATLLVAFSLLFVASSVFVTRRVRRVSANLSASESKQTGYLADSVTNVMAIKSFSGLRHEQKAFAKIADANHALTLDLMRASTRQQIYFSIVTNSIGALSLAMAVIGVMVFGSNLATVFLMFNYTSYITQQLWNFANNTLRNYNRALGDAADATRTLSIEPSVKDPAKPEKLHVKDGAIEFRDVNFTHDGQGNEALFEHLSLQIAPGEKIGLVGHSGSGKTTFTRLLLRFSDIGSGEILIDGQNIARITQDDLHRAIAYVPQEPLLFHRTIRENIAYGQPEAGEKDIIEAAKKSNAHEFIQTLPQGYDTLVGERGVKLSGGQRQRIVIARAILKHAPILVLDEATSALDSESELLIQAALKHLMSNTTSIVIAHRLSTIQHMDRIIVLDRGQIIEQGSHAELLARGGTYAKLWAHQSGGFIEE